MGCNRQRGIHRPTWRTRPPVAALAGWLGFIFAASAGAQDTADCVTRGLALVNGTIHTMDAQDSIVSSVLIEAGRFADLAVLSDDVFDPGAVPVEQIRHMTSVLTVVGGEVVYDTGVLERR